MPRYSPVAPLPGTPDTPLWYELDSQRLRVEFGPTDFVQVNASVNERLVEIAVRELGAGEGDAVLDLFCGLAWAPLSPAPNRFRDCIMTTAPASDYGWTPARVPGMS